jgi:hypothetical protein
MRICINCNEKFSGRSDKKFCSDYCRNQYNYSKSVYSEKSVLNIHKTIRKNHRIITKLFESGCNEIDIDLLRGLGFCPEQITGINYNDAIYSIYNLDFKIENNKLIFV